MLIKEPSQGSVGFVQLPFEDMKQKNGVYARTIGTLTRVALPLPAIKRECILDAEFQRFASMFNWQNRWPDNHPKAAELVDRKGKNIKTSLSEFESRLASNTYLNGCLQISQNATAENFIRTR